MQLPLNSHKMKNSWALRFWMILPIFDPNSQYKWLFMLCYVTPRMTDKEYPIYVTVRNVIPIELYHRQTNLFV